MIRPLGPSDREAILAYAYRHEAELVLVIESFNKPEPFGENRYVGSFEGERMTGVAVFFGRWQSFTVHAEDVAFIGPLVDAMMSVHHGIRIVMGFARYAEPAVEWLRAHGMAPRKTQPSIVLFLPRERFRPAGGIAEQAGEADVDGIALLQRVLHAFPEAGAVTAEERSRVIPAYTFIIRDGNTVVSKASVSGYSKHYAKIGGVVTHPDFRRLGYGRQCVSALCRSCFDRGIETMILFTAETNVPALRLYESLGFEETDRYLLAEY